MLSKTPFYIRRKASLTVEASFAAPIAIFFLVLLLAFFPVLQLQKGVEEAMQCAAREAAASAVTAQESEEDASATDAGLAYAKVLFWSDVRSEDLPVQFVNGGYAGISLLESAADNEYITLSAAYRVQMPVSLFGTQGFKIRQKVSARKWNGYDSGSGGEENSGSEIVYITQSGTAYHKDLSCHYLDLSIRSVSLSEVSSLRNANGSVYRSCSSCGGSASVSGKVYITTYGTEYHTSLGCRALKRTIQAVSINEVGDRTPCKKCYGSQ